MCYRLSDMNVQTKITIAFVIVILVILLPLQPVLCLQQERHTYLIKNGDEEYISSWILDTHGDVAVIRTMQKDELFVTTCSATGDTLKMEVTDSEENIKAWRTGDTLFVRGVINGKQVNEQYAVDEAPFYQTLTYSLRDFLSSGKKQVVFWMLHPETYKPFKIQATKGGTSTISLYGKETEVQHIRIRVSGILSILWHGDYWYRTDDHVLVEYRGLNGPPGSSQTIVRLMKTGG